MNIQGDVAGGDEVAQAQNIWASYRALPSVWQLFVAALIVLVVGSATGIGSGDAARNEALAAAHASTQDAVQRADTAQDDLDRLRSDISSLKEQVSSASIRADRAETDAGRITRLEEKVNTLSAQLAAARADRRRAAAKAQTIRTKLGAERAEVRRLRADAADLRAAADAAAVADVDTVSVPDADTGCHPSYEGDCLPLDALDVDCAGGSGDGPAFAGYVEVVGPDVYDLDADGDGYACES